MSQRGSQETRSDGLSFFVQDQFTYNRLTFNVGLRAEQWKHFASTGEEIFTFDWAVAPRLSAAFDVRGDGKQKIYGYYGRYYDPIRNNMTNFAGTLSGFVREEQVCDQRRLGDLSDARRPRAAGRVLRADDEDAVHGRLSARGLPGGPRAQHESSRRLYTNRRTRDILEDYDLALFATSISGTTDYPGPD